MIARSMLKKVFSSLRVRLILPTLIMMILIVALLTSLVSYAYTNTILRQESDKMQSAFAIASSSVEQTLQTLKISSSRLLLDSAVEGYLSNHFESDLDRVLARKEILTVLQNSLFRQPNLYGLLFFREDGTGFGVLPHRNYFFDEETFDVLAKPIVDQILDTQIKQNVWIGPVSTAELYQIKVSAMIPDQVVLGVSKAHFATYGTAYVLAVVDADVLKNCISTLADGRSRIYLATSDGTELARTGDRPLGKQTWDVVDHTRNWGSDTIIEKGSEERAYVYYQRIESLDWYLIRELPLIFYDQAVSELNIVVWKLAMVVLVLALLLLLYWLRHFMRSFEALRTAIVQVKNGQLGAQMEQPFRIAEFELIRQEFNAMNTALQRMIETTNAMERTQLELEIRNLQTRLSPHMIFNSITAIRWMAIMVGADRVADMLMELSQMLRPVFQDWQIQWSIREELEHLEHYAKLLELRYGNHFGMICDVDATLYELAIPRFTLQPLVENACEHGTMGAGGLHIDICGWREGNHICFTVRDNGVGMTSEMLEDINHRIEEGSPSEKVGLYSVYNRLKLCMGSDARLRLASPSDGGTIVFIEWSVSYGS